MKIIVIAALIVIMGGCVCAESETFLYEYREPVEAPAITVLPKERDAKWYESLAAGVGELVSFNWIVGIVKEARLGVTDSIETVAIWKRDVALGSYGTKVLYKRRGGKRFKLRDDPGVFGKLIPRQAPDNESSPMQPLDLGGGGP